MAELFEGLRRETRNVLRGLLDPKGDQQQIETLNRLRKSTTVEESRIIHNLLNDHLLFKHLQLPAEFPVSPPNFETHLRLARQPLENELSCFASRISKNREKIVWAIDAFDVLNS